MKLPDNLTPEQRAAIVECLRIAARRGAEIEHECERMQSQNATLTEYGRDEIERGEQKAKTAGMLGSDTADLADDSTTHERAVVYA